MTAISAPGAQWSAPYPPSDPTDTSSFSYETVVKRWPIIITGLIDRVYRANHDLLAAPVASQTAVESATDDDDGQDDDDEGDDDDDVLDADEVHAKVEEGKTIIQKASKLKYEMARDRTLELIPDDGQPLTEEYNAALAALERDGKNTWFTAPWLFAECYLYRLFRSYFAQTTLWTTFDPFEEQKHDAFKGSGAAVYKLAQTMHELEAERATLASDPEKLRIVFAEMLQICLWGNATDLSLLTNLTHEDIQKLQAVEREAQAARARFILKDNTDAAWAAISSVRDGRVDIILDNSGFELYTDLLFADFLVTYTPFVRTVVFHPKSMPWFVSDVTPADFAWTLHILSSSPSTFFPSPAEPNVHLAPMVARWQRYVDEGVFKLRTDDFWTGPDPYFKMPDELRDELRSESALVVFKGDLNYRKLTSDLKWPVTTPFVDALGPLAGAFPLLSLRTNKADVVVGVTEDDASRAEKEDARWRVSGRYALISFASCVASE